MIIPKADDVAIRVQTVIINSFFKEMPCFRCLVLMIEIRVELIVMPRKKAVAEAMNIRN